MTGTYRNGETAVWPFVLTWKDEPAERVEQAVILYRPAELWCSELEPYDFGSVIPQACLVDINPDEWRPL